MAAEAQKLKFALKLAKRGLYIAPLMPETKLPYAGESWLQMRSRDENTIRGWFEQRPNMNYAVSPGEDYVVLDLDMKKGKDGVGDMEQIAVSYDDWSTASIDTFTVATPANGFHRYFRSPWPVSIAHSFPKSIDIRGMDGYVVGPGCHTEYNAITSTAEGDYAIVNAADIMPLPEWVPNRLQQWVPREDRPAYADNVEEVEGKFYIDGVELDSIDRVQRAIDWLATTAKPAVEYSGGDQTTYNTFAWLREHAISVDLALELVAKHYNPRCVDSAGDPSPWTYEELTRLRDNAFKYAKREVSHVGGMSAQFESEADIIASSQSVSMEEMLARFVKEEQTASTRIRLDDAIERRAVDNDLDAHTWYGDGVLHYPAKKEFVIPRVLPAYGYVGFLARRGTGKTTILMDMALRLAHDMDWHGQPMKMGWGALVLAGEDAEGARDQVVAWMKLHNVETLSPRFVFMDAITNLLNSDSVSKWLEHYKKLAKDRRFVVFADTWQIATAGGSQNDDEVMQAAIANTKLIAKAMRGPAVMAAHPPKGNEETWSGAAVMENHSQALWKLTRETFGMNFSVPRIKGTRADYHARFEFKQQLLGGMDEWGTPESGLVPLKIGGEGVVASTDMKNRARDVRHAYAEKIYELINEAEEHEPDFAKKRHSAFSIAGTARRIIEATTHGKCERLAMMGETTLAFDLVKARIEELFKEYKQAVLVDNVAGNPIVIYLHNVPGKSSYYFRTIVQTVKKEIKPESGEDGQIPPDA